MFQEPINLGYYIMKCGRYLFQSFVLCPPSTILTYILTITILHLLFPPFRDNVLSYRPACLKLVILSLKRAGITDMHYHFQLLFSITFSNIFHMQCRLLFIVHELLRICDNFLLLYLEYNSPLVIQINRIFLFQPLTD